MVSPFSEVTNLLGADVNRIKRRTVTSVALYAIAGIAIILTFAAFLGALIILLAEKMGTVEALLIVGGAFALLAGLCLGVNSVKARRYEREARLAASARKTAMTNALLSVGALGVSKKRYMLPAIAAGLAIMYLRRDQRSDPDA